MEYTGSDYMGDIVNRRMEGKGVYTFRTGTIYKGDLVDGEFHGHGTLHFPNGGKYEADWEHGLATQGSYTFRDGLVYELEGWDYCTSDDRRFYRERVEGLKPAGESQKKNNEPAEVIPQGCFDCGDGYFSIGEGNKVQKYGTNKGEIVRKTEGRQERIWIQAKCRVGEEA
eukprot:Nk52_evm10s375 gene=Nk52_evmTU10s375